MEMATRVPMGARKLAMVALTAVAVGVGAVVDAQSSPHSQAPDSAPESASSGTSSSKTVHQKTGPYSSRSIRRTRVVEEGSQPPELAQAEASIQKQDYAAAEPLLRKVVEHDPANYVAWFDLGFVQNGLGK